MSRAKRHSKRQRQKDKRRAQRRKQRREGKKAGSIAIHSLLPGLEGAELGSMDVVVDTRRERGHTALINVVVHHRDQAQAVVWSIETGFGGHPAQVGYQVIADGAIGNAEPTRWYPVIAERRTDSESGREPQKEAAP